MTRLCRLAPVSPRRHSSRCPGLTRGAASYGLQLVYSPWRLRYVQNRWRVAPDSNRLPPASALRVCFLKHLLPIYIDFVCKGTATPFPLLIHIGKKKEDSRSGNACGHFRGAVVAPNSFELLCFHL